RAHAAATGNQARRGKQPSEQEVELVALAGAGLPLLAVPAPGLGPKSPAGDAVRAALAAGTTRLLRHDPGVRLGDDPEDVHQARVGARRLRSDLRTFAPLVEPDWREHLQDELRWLGDQLGAVRDADVLLDRLRRQASTLPERDAL